MTGRPFFVNYSPEDYDYYVQNWSITQSEDGLLYVANQGGILEYDGVEWNSFDDFQTVLSLAKLQGKIFYGASGDMGYLDLTTQQPPFTHQTRSLTEKLPDSLNPERDIWQSIPYNNGVIFNDLSKLYFYSQDTLTALPSPSGFYFGFNTRGDFYVNENDKGLLELEGDSLRTLPDIQSELKNRVLLMLPYGESSTLLYVEHQGFYIKNDSKLIPFATEADPYFSDHRVFHGIQLTDGSYALGTLGGGLVHLSKEGKILTIFTKEQGLRSNVIYHVFEDKSGLVWLALDDGIAKVELNLPLRKFDERHGINEMVRDVIRFNGEIFAGTNKGLLKMDEYQLDDARYQKSLFRSVEGIDSRITDLAVVENNLLVATAEGIYAIGNQEKIYLISPLYSSKLCPSKKYPGTVYTVHRQFLGVISAESDQFEYIGKLMEFNDSATSLVEDKSGALWLGKPNREILRLKIDGKDLKDTDPLNIERAKFKIPQTRDDANSKVFAISGDIYVGTNTGLFAYDEKDNSFDPAQKLGTFFTDTTRQFFLMEEDLKGNLWIRSARKHQLAVPGEDGSYSIHTGILNRTNKDQINVIYPDEDGSIWFGGAEGLIRYYPDRNFDTSQSYHSYIRRVLVRNDSLILKAYADKNNVNLELPYEDNALRFKVASTSYQVPDSTYFQFWLEGFDSEWSRWTSEVRKDYTNIPEGTYTFHVRARNVYDTISKADTFTFTVLAPWYRTAWAYLGYILLIGGVLYGIHKIRINRILHEQRIRNRIASDLHDEVSATLSSISYFAQAIRQSQNGVKSGRFVNLISESASEAKEKITDIIWSIDPENDDWVNLLSKCRRFASDLLESKGIEYELDIDSDVPKSLNLQLRQNLWLIFKELLTNAARHSGATKVDVAFQYRQGQLLLKVQDNGKGFNPDEVKEGNGIKNLKSRAEQISAELKLESDVEIGTRWVLKFDF